MAVAGFGGAGGVGGAVVVVGDVDFSAVAVAVAVAVVVLEVTVLGTVEGADELGAAGGVVGGAVLVGAMVVGAAVVAVVCGSGDDGRGAAAEVPTLFDSPDTSTLRLLDSVGVPGAAVLGAVVSGAVVSGWAVLGAAVLGVAVPVAGMAAARPSASAGCGAGPRVATTIPMISAMVTTRAMTRIRARPATVDIVMGGMKSARRPTSVQPPSVA